MKRYLGSVAKAVELDRRSLTHGSRALEHRLHAVLGSWFPAWRPAPLAEAHFDGADGVTVVVLRFASNDGEEDFRLYVDSGEWLRKGLDGVMPFLSSRLRRAEAMSMFESTRGDATSL